MAKVSSKWYYQFRCVWPGMPKLPKIKCLYNNLKKKLEMKLTFWMQIHIKVSYKLISTLWGSKFAIGLYYHYWWEWLSILKVLKVTSLKHFYNVSKKKLGIEFIFCMQINIKTSTSWIMVFDESNQTCPKYSKWKVRNFLKYVKKMYYNCFCVLLWCKTIKYFAGFQSCSLLLVIGWLWSKMGVAS